MFSHGALKEQRTVFERAGRDVVMVEWGIAAFVPGKNRRSPSNARLPWPVSPWYDSNMAVIEVEERVAAALRAQASLRNLSLEDFLQRIAQTAAPIHPMTTLSLADMDRSIDEVASESPVLPNSFSREEIYADHD